MKCSLAAPADEQGGYLCTLGRKEASGRCLCQERDERISEHSRIAGLQGVSQTFSLRFVFTGSL